MLVTHPEQRRVVYVPVPLLLCALFVGVVSVYGASSEFGAGLGGIALALIAGIMGVASCSRVSATDDELVVAKPFSRHRLNGFASLFGVRWRYRHYEVFVTDGHVDVAIGDWTTAWTANAAVRRLESTLWGAEALARRSGAVPALRRPALARVQGAEGSRYAGGADVRHLEFYRSQVWPQLRWVLLGLATIVWIAAWGGVLMSLRLR